MTAKQAQAIAVDPAVLMQIAGRTPDAWQARVLRNRYKRLLLNCSRQAGKSTVIAALALLEALFYAPALVLILSPSQRQSQELFRTVMQFRTALGVEINPDAESLLRVEFSSGSRIVALPGKEQNLRGFAAVSLLIIDEASRVPDDLYNSVRPMLATSGGRLAALSTPFGKRGFFHHEWSQGEGWERIKITGPECPRIPAEFLAEEKRKLPDQWYRQEICASLRIRTTRFSLTRIFKRRSPMRWHRSCSRLW